MKVNLDRVRENLIRIGEVGKVEGGGITRLAFSEKYLEACAMLEKLMEGAELEVRRDEVGNIFGIRRGKENALSSIMVGSHLDTVRNGGLFDGTLGVIGALECMYMLNENAIITKRPIEMVAFNAEEGGELGGTFGSRVMVGIYNTDNGRLNNKNNLSGLTQENIESSIRDTKDIRAFIELHIEQGSELESNGVSIGIVNSIVGITRYKILVQGETNHAGTTPMALRKDALVAASRIILKVEQMAKAFRKPLVATVGSIKAYPNEMSVIPGRVELILEIRDLDQNKINTFMDRLVDYCNNFEMLKICFDRIVSKPPVSTDEKITSLIEEICIKNKFKYQYITSGAGHDAKEIAQKVPVGMIFIPSKGGRSHCIEEFSDWEDVRLGTQLLFETILMID